MLLFLMVIFFKKIMYFCRCLIIFFKNVKLCMEMERNLLLGYCLIVKMWNNYLIVHVIIEHDS